MATGSDLTVPCTERRVSAFRGDASVEQLSITAHRRADDRMAHTRVRTPRPSATVMHRSSEKRTKERAELNCHDCRHAIDLIGTQSCCYACAACSSATATTSSHEEASGAFAE